MTLAAYGMTFLRNQSILNYVMPVGIGLILQAGWFMAQKVITGPMYVMILLVTLFLGIAFHSPYIFPLVLVLGGIVSSFNYKDFPRQNKHKFVIPWANFHLYWGFLVFLAVLVGWIIFATLYSTYWSYKKYYCIQGKLIQEFRRVDLESRDDNENEDFNIEEYK
jgi:chromate transport protein ChrA